MKKSLIKTSAALSFALFSFNTYANSDAMKMATNEAEVQAVDRANNSITLKHGPIQSKSVKMPPMTMSFPVEKAALLSTVKSGDKVKFTVEDKRDQATVTALTVKK